MLTSSKLEASLGLYETMTQKEEEKQTKQTKTQGLKGQLGV